MGSSGAGKSALTIDGGERPQMRARDSRSWTKAKERSFFETLAESCNVKFAAKAAGISASAVYVRRGRDASFRQAWDRALAIGYAQLELVMLERALHGVEKIVVARDGSQSVMRDYSDRVGLALLRMHRDSAAIADEDHGPEEVAEAAERILSRLKKIGERSTVETKAAPDLRIALIAWGLKGGRG